MNSVDACVGDARRGRGNTRDPRVTVGMAVYNGADFVAEAIESILDQTFREFELVITDNASTDGTPDICRSYAMADDRVRYHRNSVNIGGVHNENLTLELARGEYFRLAAHDDICESALLERCVEALDRDPEAVLAYTDMVAIDEHGTRIGEHRAEKGTSSDPWQRFAEFPRRDHDSEATYGLARTAVLRSAKPQGSYGHADRVWLAGLALRGRFVTINEPLFSKRYHFKNAHRDIRSRVVWFHPAWDGRFSLPYWQELFGYAREVLDAPVSASVKMRCARSIVRWAVTYSPNLAKDLAVAVQTGLGFRRLNSPDQRNWEGV